MLASVFKYLKSDTNAYKCRADVPKVPEAVLEAPEVREAEPDVSDTVLEVPEAAPEVTDTVLEVPDTVLEVSDIIFEVIDKVLEAPELEV